jgi:hypothetical protein
VSVTKVRWLTHFDNGGPWAPYGLGLSIAIGLLLLRCAFDGIFLLTWGFPEDANPLWQSDLWWAEIVNAALMGFIPAVLIISRRGINRDLKLLAPVLPGGADISTAATGTAKRVGQVFKLSGFFAGIVIVYVDPSISMGGEQSLSNPAFLWPLLRTPVFTWLVFVLIDTDFNATRAYFHIGRHLIKVDLLDVQALSPFARRGLRSALTWVIFSMIFSLFWLGDAASEQNLFLLVTVLTMATAAFFLPLIGVHNNILAVKDLELARLRDKIRLERAGIHDKSRDGDLASPRLANLVAYYQLVDGAREWPIDAANLLKFFMYLLIGLGSWLGAAMVERLLDNTLGA